MSNDIFVFHQFMPFGKRVGGIGKYILSFISNYSGVGNLKLIGVTSEKGDLFKWQEIDVGGKRINFFPVAYIKDENKKSFLPLTVRYVFGLILSFYYINYEGKLFFQRFEYFIPFMFKKKIRRFLVIHNDIESQLNPKYSEVVWSRFPRLFVFMFFILVKKSEYVFSVNSNSVSFVENNCYELHGKVSFFPTWAEPQYFFPSQMIERATSKRKIASLHGLKANCKWLLFVGRFQKQKNLTLMINVLKNLPDNMTLLMIGSGNEESEVKNMVNRLMLNDRVCFIGNVEHSKIRSYLIASDLFISTSNFEGMSVALLESLQCGTPVITTPTGESNRIIKNGFNGVVTKGWEQSEIVTAINSFSDINEQVVNDCINSVKDFSSTTIVKSIIKIME